MIFLIILTLIIQSYVFADPTNNHRGNNNQSDKTLNDEVSVLEERILAAKEKLSYQTDTAHKAIDKILLEGGQMLDAILKDFLNSGSDLYIIYQQKIINLQPGSTETQSNCKEAGIRKLSKTLYEHMMYREYFVEQMRITIGKLENAMRPSVNESWDLFTQIYARFSACSDLDCYRKEFKRVQDLGIDLDSGLVTIKPKTFLDLNRLGPFLREFMSKSLAMFFLASNVVFKEIQKCKIPSP